MLFIILLYICILLIVQLLCIILILEIYSRYFDPVTKNQHHSESINIIHHKICTRFRLIGFSKAYCHYSREPGYREPISQQKKLGRGGQNNNTLVAYQLPVDIHRYIFCPWHVAKNDDEIC
jgi:hypothetical protein